MTGIIVSQMSASLTCSHVRYDVKYGFRCYARHHSTIFLSYLSYLNPLKLQLRFQKAKNFIKRQHRWLALMNYREWCPHVSG